MNSSDVTYYVDGPPNAPAVVLLHAIATTGAVWK